MLTKQPEIGQLLVGKKDVFWEDGDPIVLQGKKYVIVGYSDKSGNPYYTYDGEKIYIDEDSWHWYELGKIENPKDASWFFDRIAEMCNK